MNQSKRVQRASFSMRRLRASIGRLLIATALAACDGAPVQTTSEFPPLERYSATHESIAFTNLDFTIASARSAFESLRDGHVAARSLVSSLLMRARFRNSFADLDEADAIARRYLEVAPESADAWMVKAEVDIALHRFDEAQVALARALFFGAPPEAIAAESTAIRVATGHAAEELAAAKARAENDPDYATLTQLAAVYAALGDPLRSDAAFGEALTAYGDVSPFAIGWVQFERAMLVLESDPARAIVLFDEALHYLPGYVSARTDRAAAMAAAGDLSGAIRALQDLCASVNDPEPAGLLAGLLIQSGRSEEAATWREKARHGFEALLTRHPLAFADHAAEFHLRIGEPQRALALAEKNLTNRDTPRSRSLVMRAKAALALAGAKGS